MSEIFINGKSYYPKETVKYLEKQLEQQKFNNKHNLSIDQKVVDELERLKNHNTVLGLQLAVAETALECIEDPRKMNHSERDDYTQKACLMNVAHVALKVMRGEHVEL